MAASAAAPALLRRAFADAPQVTLKLHHYFSAVSGAHERFLAPWAGADLGAAGGRVVVDRNDAGSRVVSPTMWLSGQD
jgi:TRAP-type transport system periplasmic protein